MRLLLLLGLCHVVLASPSCPTLRLVSKIGETRTWQGQLTRNTRDWNVEITFSQPVEHFHLHFSDAANSTTTPDDTTRINTTINVDKTVVTIQSLEDEKMIYKFDVSATANKLRMTLVKVNDVIVCQGGDRGCGVSSKDLALVKYGSPVSPGDWPWLVAMYQKTQDGLNFVCGGTLVSRNLVVTAAHCIKIPGKLSISAKDLVLFVGRHNLLVWGEVDDSQARTVSTVLNHPSWSATGRKDSDLSVLVLGSPVLYSDTVQPACLWDASLPESIVERNGTVVGWGMNEDESMSSEEPSLVNVPIVSQKDCLDSNPRFNSITTDNTFCAGSRDGSGPCKGDSGSGMYLRETYPGGEDRWLLRGLVSRSLRNEQNNECDLSNYVVFTDMRRFATWMDDVIKDYSDDGSEDLEGLEEDADVHRCQIDRQCVTKTLPDTWRSHEKVVQELEAKNEELENKIQMVCNENMINNQKKIHQLGLEKLGRRYYYIEHDWEKRKSFHEAKEFCHENGLKLVSIETAAENKLILDLGVSILDIQDFWLGGTDDGHEGRWVWATSNKPFTFFGWGVGEPNNRWGDENCLMMLANKERSHWEDRRCSFKYSFVCEMDSACG